MMEMIYLGGTDLLTKYKHHLFSSHKLLQYADTIQQAGTVLNNSWGFVDGTVGPVYWPMTNTSKLSTVGINGSFLTLCLMD